MKEYRAAAPLPPHTGIGAGGHDAADRILLAAAAAVPVRGAGALAMHEIAAAAGVSKALIHYHYRDKDALLVRVVERLDAQMTARARQTFEASSPATAIGDFESWAETEVTGGAWRATLELAGWPNADVRSAVQHSLRARRLTARELVARLYALLGLRERVASRVVGELLVAVVSGLAVLHRRDTAADSRAVFDAIALALLGLAE
jgi:AcrR family transcriptional regulator